MEFVNVGRENSGTINLYYEDHGTGKPVVLIHGWPLSSLSWEKQQSVLLNSGYRVITYDRRGFGLSSKPTIGYDYDTLSDDLDKLMTKLDLHNTTLVGFSMGGGEVARYLGKHGSERVDQAVFISSITPYLLKTQDNPQGVDGSVLERIKKELTEDRPAFLYRFFSDFYNFDQLEDKRITEEVVWLSWNVASIASPRGTIDCVTSWSTDFRNDLRRIDIPTLVIHGDSDRTVPISASGKRMPEFVKGCRLVEVRDGPHGLTWTHAEEVNRQLLDFIEQAQQLKKAA